ncbi:MAG: hypothetical protein P3X22_006465 [Thermoprotei archaeon]|nr:hypothetical protein [Thermoprotei archaeon]
MGNLEASRDGLAQALHEHLDLLEEAARSIAILRASGNIDQEPLKTALERLKANRNKISEQVKAIGEMDVTGREEDVIEDIIALLGYYVEIAYINERRLLLEVKDTLDTREDLESLEKLKGSAELVLRSLGWPH